jgi:HK97 gp10 family phage protein
MRKLEALAQQLRGNLDKAVQAVAEQAIGEVMVRAPVDTGALKASIHVEPKTTDNERTVADGVNYGIYQEFGTVKMAARPFMLPGVLAAAEGFKDAIGEWVFDQ